MLNIREHIDGLSPVQKNILATIVALFLAALLCLIAFGVFRIIEIRYRGVERSQFIMGTTIDIKINGPNAKHHAQAALDEIKRIAKLVNYHDDESELSNINKMAGITAVSVSHDTYELVKRALEISRMTGGVYDPTIGALSDVWKYSLDNNEVPSGNELVYARHLVNYRNVEIDNTSETVKLQFPGMKMDLGGIAKGYAIAKARAVLVKRGVRSALISTGSSITVIGNNHGRPWKVGIKNPKKPDEIIGAVELLPGQALSTSGDYERYREVKGKRYHHIIDPVTGMPAAQSSSVTVISSDATLSDALSTAVFIMGPARGLNFINRMDKVYGVIIDKDGNMLTTPGFILEK